MKAGRTANVCLRAGAGFFVAISRAIVDAGNPRLSDRPWGWVGYLVAGFWGSLVSTVGIFLPSFLFILLVAPILVRNRANLNVKGFVKGAYAAAIGTILGASVLLGKIAIGDWLTALIAVLSLVVLVRWKLSNPILVAATAVIGLIAFPILQPTWVFVK